MEFEFISNRPWVDETIRLRKALFFTTLFMILLGLIIGIIGIVLVAYMEFVVGVIAIIFAILLPLAYVGANILLLAKRRKDYDKNMIIDYKFTDDGLEIIKLSDTYKSKDVIDYVNLSVNKVYNKSRFIVLKTKSYYADYIVLRKSDIKLEDGANRNQVIVSFVSFLMAKVAEATRTSEVTCEVPQDEAKAEDTTADMPNEVENSTANDVTFEDLTTSDAVVDIEDEKEDIEVEPTHSQVEVEMEDAKDDAKDENISDDNADISEDDTLLDDNKDEKEDIEVEPTYSQAEVEIEEAEDDADTQDISDADATDDDYHALFDYSEEMNVEDEEKREEPKQNFFQDYDEDVDNKNE